MKEIIALIVFLSFAIVTIYLATTKHINTKLAIIFCLFSLLAGFLVANYDFIKKFKWKDLELETFERDVTTVKEKALDEIRKEIGDQKQSIKFLITNANDTRDKLEVQKKAVESLIDTVKKTEKSVEVQKANVEALNKRAEDTKRDIEILHKASADLALLLTKITWLQIETKSEFGTERAQAAIKSITEDLNRIIIVIIPNDQERVRWIQELQRSLPPRR